MRVYLVQHGASKSQAEDPQRSLNPEGRRIAAVMADHLASVGVSVGRIKHSEKLRARQTAEIFAARLNFGKGLEQVPGMGPNDDISPMRINLNSEAEDVMLVGHLPYLSRLLSSLLLVDENRPVVKFHMTGVICLELVENQAWHIDWALIPDLLLDSAIPVDRAG